MAKGFLRCKPKGKFQHKTYIWKLLREEETDSFTNLSLMCTVWDFQREKRKSKRSHIVDKHTVDNQRVKEKAVKSLFYFIDSH